MIVENCVRRLAHAQAHHGRPLTRAERFHEVFLASQESRRPLLFGQLIIMVVYLPIFALTGVEGKMFHPMAFTVVAALLGAMILSVTFVPAAVALFIGNRVSEKENFRLVYPKRIAAPLLRLQVIKMLAEAAGFTQAEVEQSFGLKAAASPRRFDDNPPFEGGFKGRRDFNGRQGRNALPRLAPRQRPLSAIETLLKLVIQHPVWAARLPIDLLPDDSPEGLALRAIVDALSVGDLPTHGIGALLEHYRGSPHAEAIDRMAGQLADSPFDEATIEPLLNDTLKKLEADAVSREIDALNAQERERGLNATERRHLAELFVRKQKHQGRTKAPES